MEGYRANINCRLKRVDFLTLQICALLTKVDGTPRGFYCHRFAMKMNGF